VVPLKTKLVMNKQSTNQKSAHQPTGTVTGSLIIKKSSRISFYIAFLAIVAVLSPFLHVIYILNDKEGIFGFAYMSSFMYSLSLPVMAICSGLLFKFLAGQLVEMGEFFRYISTAFLFVGIFFMIYTFVPLTDFSTSVYFGFISVLSIVLTIAAHHLHRAVLTTEERLKMIISKLFDFII